MVSQLLHGGLGAVRAQFERLYQAGFDPPDALNDPGAGFGQMPIVGASFGNGPQVGSDPFEGRGIQVREQPFGAPLSVNSNPFGGGSLAGGNPFGSGPNVGGDPFAMIPKAGTTQIPVTAPGATPPAGGASGGSYDTDRDKFEMYRPWIAQYAQQYGVDPDALAAILFIETDGGPGGVTAGSPKGAFGLGQHMPDTWAGLADPGDDINNPQYQIKNAAKYFAQLYKQFGNYGLAAAAYQGGPGAIVNGQPRNDIDDGNMTPAQYAALWQEYYTGIKSRAPQQLPTSLGTGGTAGLASIFPGQSYAVSQEFGHTSYSTGEGAGVYAFGTEFGLDGRQHTGWDVASPRGTQFYMPQGLSGQVTIAGGSGYYTSAGGDGPGRGELRIMLDNGMELILGHNDRINVQVGQRVTAGMLLGLTGTNNGDHLHIEVRQRDPSTRSGWRIIDPALLFGR